MNVFYQDILYKEARLECSQQDGFQFQPLVSLVLNEPVVDLVREKDVLTDVALLKEINLHVLKKEEIEFDTDFRLKLTRVGTLTV